MNDYVILTDSCIDLSNELANELRLEVVPLSVKVEEKTYVNYLDEREISFNDFYKELRSKKKTQTSQANPEDFLNVMKPFLEKGLDILSISFSSALSGTYNSTVIAAEELRELYPNRKIITIDSLSASSGQGLLLTYAAKMKASSRTIDEVASWVEDNKLNLCHLFTVDDLNHLKRGGRLSSTTAFLGTLLSVKPILHVSNEGKLVAQSKAKGRTNSIIKMVDRMEQTIVDPNGQLIYISHGDSLDDALKLRDLIVKRIPVGEVVINYVGPVIGSHSGPGTLALFYLGNDRF
jgi:DegV family protein with EDD domain